MIEEIILTRGQMTYKYPLMYTNMGMFRERFVSYGLFPATEVLTTNGFMPIRGIVKDCVVLTKHPYTKQITWKPVLGVYYLTAQAGTPFFYAHTDEIRTPLLMLRQLMWGYMPPDPDILRNISYAYLANFLGTFLFYDLLSKDMVEIEMAQGGEEAGLAGVGATWDIFLDCYVALPMTRIYTEGTQLASIGKPALRIAADEWTRDISSQATALCMLDLDGELFYIRHPGEKPFWLGAI